MVQIAKLLSAAALAALTVLEFAAAHPGEPTHVESAEQHAQRRLFMENSKRSLKQCEEVPHARRLQEQLQTKRAAKIEQLRGEVTARRRLTSATVLAKSHKSTATGIATATDSTTLFGSSPKCVLQPDVTQGPYYVNGELIRTDIRESQPGIDLYVELQFMDTASCTPVENLYVDFWHCNTTGVYSGIIANTNGNSADLTNVDKTFNRGLSPTDAKGLVTFTTTFPGHYTGRATHIHILGSQGGTVQPNKTYTGSTSASVGQLFFDQDLIALVEATDTYKANTQSITTNAKDNIFVDSTASEFDPVINYVLLGETVTDGIFGWISIGIDKSTSKTTKAAATYAGNSSASTTNITTGNTTTTTTPTPTASASATIIDSTVVAFVIAVTALLFQ